VADWHEQHFGWIDELVKLGKAMDLGGNGYPSKFTAIAEELIAQIPSCSVDETWDHRRIFKRHDGPLKYFLHYVDPAAVTACLPDEWLLVEAWDNS